MGSTAFAKEKNGLAIAASSSVLRENLSPVSSAKSKMSSRLTLRSSGGELITDAQGV